MTTAVRLIRRLVSPITRTRLFRVTAPVWMPPLESLLRGITGGRVQLSGLLVPSLVLYSTGATSGEVRRTELMYTPDGRGGAIVAGTSFARERHPGWSFNLLKHPEAIITVRGRRLPVRATLLSGAEREDAWRLIESQWPGYRAYERDSGRTVRVFRLQPVRAASTHSVPSP